MKDRTRILRIGALNLALAGALLLSAAPRADAQARCRIRFVSAQERTTATTAEEIMYSTSIPADTLNQDGEYIEVIASGRKAANANPQTHGVTFGGTTVLSTSTSGSGIDYVWRVRVYFRNSTTCTQNSQVQRGPNVLAGRSGSFACDPTVQNAIRLVATTPVQPGDVVFNDFEVMVCNN